jgi:hypothetical protein
MHSTTTEKFSTPSQWLHAKMHNEKTYWSEENSE